MASVYESGDPEKSLEQYIDGNIYHDQTYYGLGCPSKGSTGYDVPCTSRITPTKNDGDEDIGVYYKYQAATSGSGAGSKDTYTNSPDTFCPLGWQLPYVGTGGDYYDQSKSWKYLFNRYGYDNTPAGKEGIWAYPLSYIFAGHFYWNKGSLSGLNGDSHYWSSTVDSEWAAFRLYIWVNGYAESVTDNKLYGFTVRCVTRY